MFFDPTKDIKLDNIHQKIYGRLQIGLYFMFALVAIFMAYLALFPTLTFNFSFSNPASNKGSVLNPRTKDEVVLASGVFPANEMIEFDSSLVGNFSKSIITFQPKKQAPAMNKERVFLRKSYQAFLYPEGTPLGFQDGTLLRSGSEYYIVSDRKLRQFLNTKTLNALGFSPEAFVDVSSDELSDQQPGALVSDDSSYPIATLFQISDNYYALRNDLMLVKFLSAKAFLSRYADNIAINKDESFLENYELAPEMLGFADGSLVSLANSAYIASGEKLYPIGDPEIFINQGYDWNDIVTITSDEFSFYEKEKLFSLTSPHPDGTIFHATDSDEWYLVKENQKHRFASEKTAKSWLKASPILVTKKSQEALGDCDLDKALWGKYVCEITINESETSPGNYYEFSLTPGDSYELSNLNVRFVKNITKQNLKISLLGMLQKIKARYGIQSINQ